MAATRLSQVLSFIDTDDKWNGKKLPTFDELPMFKDFKGCAWDLWGSEDQLGSVNLLTPDVVKRAATEGILTGESVSLNWPLNFPSKPMFGRRHPELHQKLRHSVGGAVRDDELHINTQSGTQWDGLRHFGILEHNIFYNNTPNESLPLGIIPMPDPRNIDPQLTRIGIQGWANHGICGRGVFLDLVKYYTSTPSGTQPLPYDPWTTHAIPASDLINCATKQGVKFRKGDILIMRMGFMQKYNEGTNTDRAGLSEREETFAGIEQSDEMKRFLWDNHFAAVASDQPALERWPTPEGTPHMHQTIIGLWGMPIGEFFDLEKLSEVCTRTGRYTFFFSSWPLNIIGGCASTANAAAFF